MGEYGVFFLIINNVLSHMRVEIDQSQSFLGQLVVSDMFGSPRNEYRIRSLVLYVPSGTFEFSSVSHCH